MSAQRIGNFAIRRPCVSDHDGIREFLTGLSPRARYLRFFSGAPPTSQAMLRILAGAGAQTDVLVATGDGVIIGHAIAGDGPGPAVPGQPRSAWWWRMATGAGAWVPRWCAG